MIDLLHDINGELILAGEDLATGVSDLQHQQDLLLADKGSIPQYLEAGVGAATWLENEDSAGLLRETGLQFTADGMEVKELSYAGDGNMNVNAKYK